MIYSSQIKKFKTLSQAIIVALLTLSSTTISAQICPANVPATISTNPDTYYPGLDNVINAGGKSITLGAAGFGSTPIASGDLLLIIQMQGAQINSTNTTSYGDGTAGGSRGYLNNSSLLAGNMEYVVATNSVPLTGGTLSLMNGTVNSYKNSAFGTDGQYRFQIIRIGLYYSLTLAGPITAPAWNGTSGGIVVISVTNDLNFNGQTISAQGAGFRGGGARQLSGQAGGSNSDVVSMSTSNFNGSKGEGIAGTPRFLNNNGVLLDNGSANEGYPGGSHAAGAPGNAGGGGTDGRPTVNDENSGGGGGSNGGAGGKGGNSWNSNLPTGGESGTTFAQRNPSRLVLGGGGGAGTTNNGTGTPASGFSTSGAAGGGIVLITAGSITGSGTINVNGASGNTTTLNDGSGGGGAGGSALIYSGSGLSGITVLANGGTGGSNAGGSNPAGHGPGGGGGGGVIFSNDMLNAATSAAGGSAGHTTAGDPYGALNGSSGVLTQNVSIGQLPSQNLNCSILPVRFKSVNANYRQQEVTINWEVTNEVPLKNYIIERSNDGITFSQAGVVAYHYSANGDNAYSFTDTKNEATGIVYYRIRFVSGGKPVYSTVMSIRIDEETMQQAVISPNPATGGTAQVTFTMQNAKRQSLQLRMLSAGGAVIWQRPVEVQEGTNSIAINNLASIPNGLYFIQYNDGSKYVNMKMMVHH
jgi:hypothetical protein